MAKKKFERRHITPDEKDRLFRRDEEPTAEEIKNAERYRKMMAKLGNSIPEEQRDPVEITKRFKDIDPRPEGRAGQSGGR